MAREIKARVQLRHSTTEEWNRDNPILADGELGFDTTINDFKIGDGVTEWLSLDYVITKKINDAITVALNGDY